MSGACAVVKKPLSSSAGGQRHTWDVIRRVLITYVACIAGCAVAGALYGLFVATLRWSLSGSVQAFGLVPPYMMALGAGAGVLLATAVVVLYRPRDRKEAGSRDR